MTDAAAPDLVGELGSATTTLTNRCRVLIEARPELGIPSPRCPPAKERIGSMHLQILKPPIVKSEHAGADAQEEAVGREVPEQPRYIHVVARDHAATAPPDHATSGTAGEVRRGADDPVEVPLTVADLSTERTWRAARSRTGRYWTRRFRPRR